MVFFSCTSLSNSYESLNKKTFERPILTEKTVKETCDRRRKIKLHGLFVLIDVIIILIKRATAVE